MAVGTPRDPQERVIGLMVMLSRRPLANPELCVSTLRIFATRAAAELERKQAEEAVHASENGGGPCSITRPLASPW